jgi:hypothetical protein
MAKKGKSNDQPTNGPYAWGNGPQPKPKGIIARLIAKAAKTSGSNT